MTFTTVADAFDGATRMLGDAQHFGPIVRAIHFDAADGSPVMIRLTLGPSAGRGRDGDPLARSQDETVPELCYGKSAGEMAEIAVIEFDPLPQHVPEPLGAPWDTRVDRSFFALRVSGFVANPTVTLFGA